MKHLRFLFLHVEKGECMLAITKYQICQEQIAHTVAIVHTLKMAAVSISLHFVWSYFTFLLDHTTLYTCTYDALQHLSS